MIEALESLMMGLDGWMIYLAIFIFMSMNGFMSTPPSELTWGIAGLLVASKNISPFLCVVSGVAGNVLGTSGLFLIGRRWGEQGFRLVFAWSPFLGEYAIDFSRKVFRKYGEIIVAAGRFVPQVRSIISLPAGIAKMNTIRFEVFTLIGCLVWGLLWLGLGRSIGPTLLEKLKGMKSIANIFGISIIALILLYYFWNFYKHIIYKRKIKSKR